MLRPFLLRRLKSDVEKGLPPKKETILKMGMSEMQKKYYAALLQKDIEAVTAGARFCTGQCRHQSMLCRLGPLPKQDGFGRHVMAAEQSVVCDTMPTVDPAVCADVAQATAVNADGAQWPRCSAHDHRLFLRRSGPIAAAEHRDAAAQVLQPSVPVPGRRAGAALHHRRASCRELWYGQTANLSSVSRKVASC